MNPSTPLRALIAEDEPILAATLAMSLSRSPETPTPRKLAAEFLMLPLIALTAGLVGAALRSLPPLGAALFIGGIVLSILLRRYGETARTVGRVLAIPLICILVVPVHVEGVSTRWVSAAVVIAAGLAAMLCSAAAAWIGARIGWIEAKPESETRPRLERTPSTTPLHISTRMALQMLVALGLAFAIGMTVFPAHWAWVVLTAFIVCSGSVSRGDAIYKGLMRLGGAVGGASLAAAIAHIAVSDPVYDAAIIFVVLFVGIWLRQINYAWWAICATLIFALLQGPQDQAILPLLGMRIVCILIGALCGVAAAWFVFNPQWPQFIGTPPMFFSAAFLSDYIFGLAIGGVILGVELLWGQRAPAAWIDVPVRKAAAVSFTLYLIHFPLMVTAGAIFPYNPANPWHICAIVAVILTIALALGSWIEPQRRAWTALLSRIFAGAGKETSAIQPVSPAFRSPEKP